MRVLGIDLASSPDDTAACVLDESLNITIHGPCDDDDLVQLAEGCDKVAIDAPFGWPDPFIDALVAYRDRRRWTTPSDVHPKDHRGELVYRLTDRVVSATRNPLSVSTDRIGVTAMRCAHLLDRLSPDEPVDRTGAGVLVEVYPAAALARWGLEPSGYKGDDAAPMSRLLARISERLPKLELDPATVRSHHAFDAVVCALIARASALRLTEGPRPGQRERASSEGWIHLPLRGSLPLLSGSPDLSRSPKPALAAAAAAGGQEVDDAGYLASFDDALVRTLDAATRHAVRSGLEGKGGSELVARGDGRAKFLAAHSSAALAANTFGPFLTRREAVPLPGWGSIGGEVELEGRVATGLQGGAATLDCLIRDGASAVGIEVKLTETFDSHVADFSAAYEEALRPLHRSWRAEYERLVKAPAHYRYLDAAQLVKHYVGLRRAFNHPRLLYLHWEPQNAPEVAVTQVHAAEAEAFTAAVATPGFGFRAAAYQDLLMLWSESGQPEWLRAHAEALAKRYTVAV